MKFLIFISLFILPLKGVQACAARERTKSSLLAYGNNKLPGCFDDQKKLLSNLGYPGPFASDEIRIFILNNILKENSLYGTALKSLAALTDEEGRKLRSELMNLKYVIHQVGNSQRGLDKRVTAYLSSSRLQTNWCQGKPPHCLLEQALKKNHQDLTVYANKRWEQLRRSPQVSTVGGVIPDGKLGSSAARDFATAKIAHEIFDLNLAEEFSPEDWQRISDLNSIYEKTIAPFYTGRSALVKNIEVFHADTDVLGPMTPQTIDHAVRSFSTREWFGGNMDSDITAETSRSPLLDLFGPGARRVTFWPWDTFNRPLEYGTGQTRYSEIFDGNGILRAIEVIARDFFQHRSGIRVDEAWEPFVYEEHWGHWFPTHKIQNVPVKDFCMSCHVSENGNFSPLPKNATTFQEMKDIGYKNDALIHNLLKFGSTP